MRREYLRTINIFLIALIMISCNRGCNESKKEKGEEKYETITTDKLNKLIEKEPNNPDLYNERAKAYLEIKKTGDALSDINKAINLNPKKAQYFITLSDIYFATGKVGRCRESLEKALELEPKNTEALLKTAELHFYFKRYEETYKYINKAIDTDKNNSRAYFMRGMALKEAGDTVRAIIDLQKTTELDGTNFEAYLQLGMLFSKKKNSLATEYFDNAIKLDTNSIEARYAKAMYMQEVGEYNEAIKLYKTILRINPEYKYAYYNIGYIHLVYLQVYKTAIEYFTKAIMIDGNYAEAYYNRGYSYELGGDIRNAMKDYQKALSIKSNYKKAIDGLNRIQ